MGYKLSKTGSGSPGFPPGTRARPVSPVITSLRRTGRHRRSLSASSAAATKTPTGTRQRTSSGSGRPGAPVRILRVPGVGGLTVQAVQSTPVPQRGSDGNLATPSIPVEVRTALPEKIAFCHHPLVPGLLRIAFDIQEGLLVFRRSSQYLTLGRDDLARSDIF